MAYNSDDKFFGVKEISENIKVSRTYLSKILQKLVREGFLKSVTGPGGGFALAKPPEKITLIELLRIVDGGQVEFSCILGMGECSDENPCPVHDVWIESRNKLLHQFYHTTVKDAMKKSWPIFRGGGKDTEVVKEPVETEYTPE